MTNDLQRAAKRPKPTRLGLRLKDRPRNVGRQVPNTSSQETGFWVASLGATKTSRLTDKGNDRKLQLDWSGVGKHTLHGRWRSAAISHWPSNVNHFLLLTGACQSQATGTSRALG